MLPGMADLRERWHGLLARAKAWSIPVPAAEPPEVAKAEGMERKR